MKYAMNTRTISQHQKKKEFFLILRNKLKKIGRMVGISIRNTIYIYYYHKKALNPCRILIESRNGHDLAGNMFGILKEVTGTQYAKYEVLLSVAWKKSKAIKRRVNENGLEGVSFVRKGTGRYYTALSSAKYIFVDTALPKFFLKKEGQVIVNTWHGTPLKHLGIDVHGGYADLGEVINSFSKADYLIFPNDFMWERMTEAYELSYIFHGKILLEGYPRNSMFFQKQTYIKDTLGLHEKQFIVYMPTWRDAKERHQIQKQIDEMHLFLKELDEGLAENQFFYVKLHPLMSGKLKLKKLKHIYEYPIQYDVYEFLRECDVLVTDYSSVLFDYANSGKKIILFPYDEESYQKSRGFYFPLEEMPFPIVNDVDELVKELSRPKNYDDTEFRKKFCTFDCLEASKKICNHVIKEENTCRSVSYKENGKKNILFYMIDFSLNGITTAFRNLLDSIDLEQNNYYVAFDTALNSSSLALEELKNKGVILFPINMKRSMTLCELLLWQLYKRFSFLHRSLAPKVNLYFEREAKGIFGRNRFAHVVHYSGYDLDSIILFEHIDAQKVIFVHNDMAQETMRKKDLKRELLEEAYRKYDRIAVVTEDLILSTEALAGSKEKIRVVSNVLDYQIIKEKAKAMVSFDSETISNFSLEKIREIFSGEERCIMTCGRFSWEKNHFALMEAFERFVSEYPKYWLFIIGGYGPLFDKTMEKAKKSKASKIVVIKSVQNPYSFMREADLFVLPSRYEGLGLTLLEADSLSIPTAAANVCGPAGFVKRHGGVLFAPEPEDIYQYLIEFHTSGGVRMNVDYDTYNRKACREFMQLLEDDEEYLK